MSQPTFENTIATINQARLIKVIRMTAWQVQADIYYPSVNDLKPTLNTNVFCLIEHNGLGIYFEAVIKSPEFGFNLLADAVNDPLAFMENHRDLYRVIPKEGTQDNGNIQIGGILDDTLDLDNVPQMSDSYEYYDESYLYTDTLSFMSASLIEQLGKPDSILAKAIINELCLG